MVMWLSYLCMCAYWIRIWFRPDTIFNLSLTCFAFAFATGVASQQGTLTLPDTWFRPPFWDLLIAPIVETKFLELAMSLLDFSPRISLGTFSILLCFKTFQFRISFGTFIGSLIYQSELKISKFITSMHLDVRKSIYQFEKKKFVVLYDSNFLCLLTWILTFCIQL